MKRSPVSARFARSCTLHGIRECFGRVVPVPRLPNRPVFSSCPSCPSCPSWMLLGKGTGTVECSIFRVRDLELEFLGEEAFVADFGFDRAGGASTKDTKSTKGLHACFGGSTDESLPFQPVRTTEMDQQADLQTAGFEVVEDLCFFRCRKADRAPGAGTRLAIASRNGCCSSDAVWWCGDWRGVGGGRRRSEGVGELAQPFGAVGDVLDLLGTLQRDAVARARPCEPRERLQGLRFGLRAWG